MAQRIGDVMTLNPKTVTEKESVVEVARIMRDQDIGVVPVVEGRKIIGVVTDRDIVVRALADGKDCKNISVKDVMTKNIHSVKEETPVDEVFNLMSKDEIRRVPVVNHMGDLVGIVSIGDLARKTNRDNKVGKVVENISEAPPNN